MGFAPIAGGLKDHCYIYMSFGAISLSRCLSVSNIMNASISKHEIGKMSRSEAGKLGYIASAETLKNLKEQRITEYNQHPTLCKGCQQPLSYQDILCHKIFCSSSCSAIFHNRPKLIINTCPICQKPCGKKKFCNQKCRTRHTLSQYILEWKDGKTVCFGKTLHLNPHIRSYLFEKYQHKCCKCGWNQVNSVTNKIPLEVNHIDGDASNCRETNLELLCPNCHSLTPNFRSLNKVSKRIRNGAVVG